MSLELAVKPKTQMELAAQAGSIFDLVIIGGGPAGLTAAIYAGRSRLKTLIVERMVLGGLATTAFQIENYPGFPETVPGHELTKKMADQANKLGVEVLWASAAGLKRAGKLWTVDVNDKSLKAKAIIMAAGSESAKLDVPGEAKFRGRGVSYCATCDGAFYKDKNLIVVGGGNSAIEEAIFLTRFAGKVSIVHRRDELRADKILAERAKHHPKIYFFWHALVEEIRGEKKVSEVALIDLLSGKKLIVPADGIFIYIGSKPNTELVKGLAELDEWGYIKTDDKMKTSAEGLFAAGDVRVKSLRQIITAAADGAVAAESAREFIESFMA